VDEIEVAAFHERLFDGDILDHPPDLAPVVEGQFTRRLLVPHLRQPAGLVVAALLISSDQSSRQAQ